MKLAVQYVSLPALLICSVFLAEPVIAQQTRSSSSVLQGCSDISREYDHALDVVFPRPTRTPTGSRELDYSIVLRYQPSLHVESQIVFEKDTGGKLRVTEYTLPEGTPSVLARLWKVYEARRCPTDADFIGTKLIIKDLDPTPTRITDLVTSLFQQPITLVIDPNMRNSKSRRAFMEDGARYLFWLNGDQNSAFFELQGPYRGQFDSPLYDEVDRLRLAVESAK